MARGWTCVVHHAAAHAAPRDAFCNTRGKTGQYARERERKRERKKMREKEGEKEAERERWASKKERKRHVLWSYCKIH